MYTKAWTATRLSLNCTINATRCLRHHLPKCLGKTTDLITDKVSTHSYFGFSHYIKRYLIDKYPSTCIIEDCYVCNNWYLNVVTSRHFCISSKSSGLIFFFYQPPPHFTIFCVSLFDSQHNRDPGISVDVNTVPMDPCQAQWRRTHCLLNFQIKWLVACTRQSRVGCALVSSALGLCYFTHIFLAYRFCNLAMLTSLTVSAAF